MVLDYHQIFRFVPFLCCNELKKDYFDQRTEQVYWSVDTDMEHLTTRTCTCVLLHFTAIASCFCAKPEMLLVTF